MAFIFTGEGAGSLGRRLLLVVVCTCAFWVLSALLATAANAAGGTEDTAVDRSLSGAQARTDAVVPADLLSGTGERFVDRDTTNNPSPSRNRDEDRDRDTDEVGEGFDVARSTAGAAEAAVRTIGERVVSTSSNRDEPSNERVGGPVGQSASADDGSSGTPGPRTVEAVTDETVTDETVADLPAPVARLAPADPARSSLPARDPVDVLLDAPAAETLDDVVGATTPVLDTVHHVLDAAAPILDTVDGVIGAPAPILDSPRSGVGVVATGTAARTAERVTPQSPGTARVAPAPVPAASGGTDVSRIQRVSPGTSEPEAQLVGRVDLPGVGLSQTTMPGPTATATMPTSRGGALHDRPPPGWPSPVPPDAAPSPSSSNQPGSAGPSPGSTSLALLPALLSLIGLALVAPFGPERSAVPTCAFLSLAERPG